MQIHNLIVGILFLGVVAGCAKQLQELPDVLAARRTIDEIVDVRSRQNLSFYKYDALAVQRKIGSITNEHDRLRVTHGFLKKVLEFDMPNVPYVEQCNIIQNYSDLLCLGRQIIRQSAFGDKVLIDFTVDGLLKSRQLCCSISLENQRPDERLSEFYEREGFIRVMRSYYPSVLKDITADFLKEDLPKMSSEMQAYARRRLEEIPKERPILEFLRHGPKATWRDEKDRLIGRVPPITNQVESGKGNSHAPKK